MKPRSKLITGTLIGTLVGVTLFIAAAGAGVAYLRSPAGSRWLMRKIQHQMLNTAGIQLDYSEAVVDPFGHLLFKNVRMTRPAGAGRVEVEIPVLEARYRFSVFSREVEIERVLIERPSVVFHSKDSPGTAKPDTSGKGSIDPAKLLSNLPLKLKLRELAIDRFSLDLDFRLPGSRVQARFRDFALKTDLDAASGRLVFHAGVRSGTPMQIHYSTLKGGAETRVDLSCSLAGKLGIELLSPAQEGRRTDGRAPVLVARTEPSEFHATIEDLELMQRPAGGAEKGALRFQLPRIAADTTVGADLTLGSDLQARIQKLDLGGGVRIAPGKLELGQRKIRWSTQELHWQGGRVGESGAASAELVFQGDGIYLEPDSLRPLDLNAKFKLALDSATGGFSGNGAVALSHEELFRTEWKSTLGRELFLQAKSRLVKPGALARFFKAAEPLKKFKEFEGDLEIGTELGWNSESGVTTFKGSLKPEKQSLVLFHEPLEMAARMSRQGGMMDFHLEAGLKDAELPRRARIENLWLRANIHSPQPRDFEFDFSLNQKLLTLAPELAGRAVAFPDFEMTGRGSIEDNDRFDLEKLVTSLKSPAGSPLLKLETDASGSLRSRNFENSGKAELILSEDLGGIFAKLADQEISGKILAPWELTIRRGKDVSFEGDLQATAVNWSKGPLRVEGFSGSVPVSETLVWDGKKPRFASLIRLNPFERVDFERFRPLVERSDRLRIERIGFEEKSYGPINGFFSIRQNMLFANELGCRLGAGGRAGEFSGEFYFDGYPANLQLGVLSRLTGLDLAETLPKRLQARAPAGEKRISARSNLVLNFNRASLDGRIDVTEIGGGQLITLINALDPKYENEQMNRARSLLGIAYPTQVELAFRQGFLDMGIQLGGLLSDRLSLRGIPLSGWMTGMSAQVVKKTEGGILK